MMDFGMYLSMHMLLAFIMYARAVAGFGASASSEHPEMRDTVSLVENRRVGGAEPPNCIACNCWGERNPQGDAVYLWRLSSPAERGPAAAIGDGM